MARRGRAWFGGLAARCDGVEAIDETTRRVRIVLSECVSRHFRKSDEGSAYVVLLRRRKKDVQEDGWKRIGNPTLELVQQNNGTSYRRGYESPLAIGIWEQKNGSRLRELLGLSIGIETRVHINNPTVTCLCRHCREALVVHPLLLRTKQTYFDEALSRGQAEQKPWLILHGFDFFCVSLGCERDPQAMHVR